MSTISTFIGAYDPCQPGNYITLFNSGRRGSLCKERLTEGICDRDLPSGWYKVQHEDDTEPRKMVDSTVDMYYCGTAYPVWLNGRCSSFIIILIVVDSCSLL